jgi:hypothetical protein
MSVHQQIFIDKWLGAGVSLYLWMSGNALFIPVLLAWIVAGHGVSHLVTLAQRKCHSHVVEGAAPSVPSVPAVKRRSRVVPL